MQKTAILTSLVLMAFCGSLYTQAQNPQDIIEHEMLNGDVKACYKSKTVTITFFKAGEYGLTFAGRLGENHYESISKGKLTIDKSGFKYESDDSRFIKWLQPSSINTQDGALVLTYENVQANSRLSISSKERFEQVSFSEKKRGDDKI